MHSKFISLNLDFLGFSASMICALHCIAVPFVLTFGALSGLSWIENHAIETFFIFLSIVLASLSLISAYRKEHRQLNAIYIVSLGFLIIISSRFMEGHWHLILAALGGFLIATAHFVNWRLLKNMPKQESLSTTLS